jgi:hypothetical protein
MGTTLRVRVFDNAIKPLGAINDSFNFHRILNKENVVSHGVLRSFDQSFAYPEWTTVYAVDLEITFPIEIIAQDDETTDAFIEKVKIDGEIGDHEVEINNGYEEPEED